MVEFDEKILKEDVLVEVTDENQLMNILKWGDSKGFKWVSGSILLDITVIKAIKLYIFSSKDIYLNLGKKTIWGSELRYGSMYVDYDKALLNKKVLLKEKPGFDLVKAMSMYKDIANVVFLSGKKITIVTLKTGEIGVAMLREGDVYSKEKGFLYAYVKALRSKTA